MTLDYFITDMAIKSGTYSIHNSLYTGGVPNTLNPGWDETNGFTLTLGSTVHLATYIDMTTKELVTTVKNLSGSTIKSLRISIKPDAFTTLKMEQM